MGKRVVYSFTPNRKDQALSLGELAVAGALSAVPATLVAGPAERVKVLLQVREECKAGQWGYADCFDRCKVEHLEVHNTLDPWTFSGSYTRKAV
jgi:solute carrier family 25 carnitine/acylcarnitine transporter 20/29